MVTGGGDIEAEAKALGMPVEFLMDSDKYRHVDVYPDNWRTVLIFSDVLTQWRTGPGGLVGLDYGILPLVFRMREIPRDDRPELFDGIRVMESAALAAIREQNG